MVIFQKRLTFLAPLYNQSPYVIVKEARASKARRDREAL